MAVMPVVVATRGRGRERGREGNREKEGGG
jgi:hypothetical protein